MAAGRTQRALHGAEAAQWLVPAARHGVPTFSPDGPVIPDAPLLVACLCARWCQLCGEYRTTFCDAQQRGAGRFRFIWLDIEDDEAILGPVDVDDFPTLLIADARAPLFFGPLTPQPATLERLLQSAEAGRLAPLADRQTIELTARIRAAADQSNDAGA